MFRANLYHLCETNSTRQVVTGLTTLQAATDHLLRAYIAHTSSILGGGSSAGFDTLAISNPLATPADAGIAVGIGATAGPGAGAAAQNTAGPTDAKVKRKRTKREREPNEPPRPLTAYFLYAKHARSVIKADLGENVKPGEIANEATRRWNEMPEHEKAVRLTRCFMFQDCHTDRVQMWKESYRDSLAKYQVAMKEFRANNANAAAAAASPEQLQEGDLDDEPPAVGAEIDLDEEDSGIEDHGHMTEQRKVPLPPQKTAVTPKEPTPVNTKRRRTKDAAERNPAAPAQVSSPVPALPPTHKETRVPVPGSAPPKAPAEAPKTAEKRKKTEGKSVAVEEPKKKRVRKSVAAEDEESSKMTSDAVPSPEKKEKRSRPRKSDSGRI